MYFNKLKYALPLSFSWLVITQILVCIVVGTLSFYVGAPLFTMSNLKGYREYQSSLFLWLGHFCCVSLCMSLWFWEKDDCLLPFICIWFWLWINAMIYWCLLWISNSKFQLCSWMVWLTSSDIMYRGPASQNRPTKYTN